MTEWQSSFLVRSRQLTVSVVVCGLRQSYPIIGAVSCSGSLAAASLLYTSLHHLVCPKTANPIWREPVAEL